ncbi:L,D-transpeptidase family protein [Altererythrobacter soli]|uniref:L,D-transpeptidase family protein n=1 Tax=Croceibacterium soli TaxID=1739690 RepID=A0A6I4UUV2_9SPHN|nr:L,D-transpeptidase family protein [Croceibacterium soli]MXP42702.1 L,D-transpeptidase family protein [Croceibacterium soli]
MAKSAGGELRTFYAYASSPLWISPDGSLDPAARALLELVQTAEYDGIAPAALEAAELAEAIQAAEAQRTPEALERAELLLSRTLAAYVAALRRPTDAGMIYEHDALRPELPSTYLTLDQAAKAPSLQEYVRGMAWMHPLYAPLRRTLLTEGGSAAARQLAIRNLERIRQIPAQPRERHVLVDTASARLWMYEGNRPVDSMRVVVGKPDSQTPSISGWIRHAIADPYWNVPSDLVRKTIAPGVLRGGAAYLKARGYEVLSGWEEEAELLDPKSVDWRAVQRGELDLRVRQRPGASNAMGEMKFEFPNPFGIYLHDTPDKDLLAKEARYFSNGCIRLEDADRLARWLLGGTAAEASSGPEQKIDLARPVPIYVAYLTAHADGDRIALGPDPYGRDKLGGTALAALAD